ncbi:DUF222 domain-containing protein [Mycobacterium manitobense]|uniref:DUF222 domain-containing protein n=1 Tax=[Mycobacterium] manitobense TaxID=190147 RepID=A0A9X2Y9Y8_9MYCO|nr:HNH endonuclease signature motif containing protein [[Mycobacterium] manitobense]MCV7170662.1 DUF222 domain-containing protein [[Mycobacterium] manitobense]
MFDTMSDAEVAEAIEESARACAASDAHRLAAIAELVSRRIDLDGEREYWACDFWDAASAEVAAAMGISARAAARHMHIALALRDRLPKVAALYAQGWISSQLISTITWRTQLVDDDAVGAVDTELARRAGRWGPLSVSRLEQAIDQIIDTHDPGARRRTRTAARTRDLTIGDRNDVTGITSLWGRLFATDAALLDHRLTEMARQVCDQDPRTMGQRRADALGALGAGAHTLACQCDTHDCPATTEDGRATHVVIHVVADQSALDARPDPAMHGDHDTPAAAPEPAERPRAALIVGGGIIPGPLLAELIARGARVRDIRTPCEAAEQRYRPSAALADFVRMRDMTCRYPGCDRPAVIADIDHTVAHPRGPTHASNLKCLCRHHHLLKTFWAGFSDRQLPDGSITWTTPAGRTYTTHPGSRLFFPDWHTTTTELPPPTATSPPARRGAMMPRRRHTRAQARAQRIKAERALNDPYLAHRNKPPPM